MPKFGWFSDGEQVHVPIESEDFQPTGLIAPLNAVMAYQFWTPVDLADGFTVPKWHYRHQTRKGKWEYYYLKPEEAKAAMKEAEVDRNPTQVWTFQIETEKVMNTSDVKRLKGGADGTGGFGPVISLKAQVVGYRGLKNRHEFHLMALPAIVGATAKAWGYDVPALPSMIDLIGKEVKITDEMRLAWLGDPEERDMAVVMANSIMGQYRTALWAALGESDPLKYAVNAQTSKGPSIYNATASKLIECLDVYIRSWSGPIYGRLLIVTSPVVDEFTTLLPIVSEIYPSKVVAEKAAQEDIDRITKAQEKKGNPPASRAGKPPLPQMWADAGEGGEEGWLDTVRGLVKANPQGKQPKPIWEAKLLKLVDPDVLGGTAEEVKSWLPFVS